MRSQSRFEGWSLLGWLSGALLLMTLLILAWGGFDIEAVRLAIRTTARTSIVLFLIAFTASSVARLWPNSATRWILRNRRYFGLSFAASHFIHAAMIATLAYADWPLFQELTQVASNVSGGIAYVFIALMAATSFDRAVAWLGPRKWQALHTVGAWYIWGSFVAANGKRIPTSPYYWLPIALLAIALAIRIAAWISKRRSLSDRSISQKGASV